MDYEKYNDRLEEKLNVITVNNLDTWQKSVNITNLIDSKLVNTMKDIKRQGEM
jgi:hypothetical protein